MARVFVSPAARQGDRFVIEGDAFHHIVRVLRLGAGDRFHVVDGSASECLCEAIEATSHMVIAAVIEERPLLRPAVDLHLYCGMLKGDRLDLVLQKGTEVGVTRFGLFRSVRATVRVAPADAAARLARWRRIVESAVGQCGRADIPTVRGPLDFEAMLTDAASADMAFIPWESPQGLPTLRSEIAARLGGADGARAGASRGSVALIVGPEGGFEGAEIAAARDRGIEPVTLGPHILRAETAALIAPVLVLAAAGQFG